jgi:thiol:disulfide interchange protein DsbD
MFAIRWLAAASFAVSLFASALPGEAAAQPVRADRAEVELVADVDAIVPGQALTVALRIRHEPHWHTYWQVPGDSGLPTRINWRLPEGFAAGPIEWPVPQRLPVGPLMNFGYDGEVLLLNRVQAPAALAAGSQVELAARADFLICKDVCIPSGADVKLALPVRVQAQPTPTAAQIEGTRARIPQPLALERLQGTLDGKRIRLAFAPPPQQRGLQTLEFFPLEEGRIEPAARQSLAAEASDVALYLEAMQPVAADFKRLKGVLVANGGPGRIGGWAGVIDAPLVAGTIAAAPAPTGNAGPVSAGTMTLLFALAGAFIGGLILNLMPCVFPVLSLKLLGLVQHHHAHHEGGPSLPAHGVTFAGGVIASFVLLAVALIALKAGGAQLGWGFQLQTPWVVAALTALFFLIGLNLLGAFEFTWGAGLANAGAAQRLDTSTLRGSFGTGVLAVVIASPCTAPFMGAALGYAVTQSAPVTLAVFAALGVGMAAPYLLLTIFPGLLARLPKPGAWTERFRQMLAFPMFVTCVWLLWVLAQQVDVNAVGLVLVALVTLGLAAWATGIAQRGGRGFGWLALAAAVLAVYAVVEATGEGAAPAASAADASKTSLRKADDGAWKPWSAAAVQRELDAGRPVFVDFTAAWCVTCQANKRLVLNSSTVERAFVERNVARMRADWTNRDDAITQELARFGRNGVPLYVVYDKSGKATVLPELLTERTVLEALPLARGVDAAAAAR